jgi:hypothetical protein
MQRLDPLLALEPARACTDATDRLRRIRVEHGIAHLKNWRAVARHLGCRERMSDTIQAIAGLLSHQQTADLNLARQM